MPPLPSGTVTFLFTDLEGPTTLLREVGDAARRPSFATATLRTTRLRRTRRSKRRSLRWGTDPEAWNWFGAEQDNLRAAAAWFAEADRYEDELRLASTCADYWLRTGSWAESSRLLEEALGGELACPPRVRARALIDLANLRWRMGAYDDTRALADEALALIADDPEPSLEIEATNALAITEWKLGNDDASRAHWKRAEAGAHASGDDLWVAVIRTNLGILEVEGGDFGAARGYFDENIVNARRLVANNLLHLATMAVVEGEAERAAPGLRECLAISEELGLAALIPWTFVSAAAIALERERVDSAAKLLGAATRLVEELSVSKDINPTGTEVQERTIGDLRERLGERSLTARSRKAVRCLATRRSS